jgi:hypothetical protein
MGGAWLEQATSTMQAIAPRSFDTAMLGGLAPDVYETLSKIAVWPPRAGRPDEFADLVMAIVTNRMLNGEVMARR